MRVARPRRVLLAALGLALVQTAACGQPTAYYLDRPSALLLVGEARPGRRLPLVLVLPATGESAVDVYGALAPHLGLDAYVAVIPEGVPSRADYSPDFPRYAGRYERRVELDLARARAQYPIDDDKTYVAGFSLGGDLAWASLAHRPERFRGALIFSSGCSTKMTASSAATLRRRGTRVVFVVGERDPRRAGLERARKTLADAAASTRLLAFPGGHELPPDPAVLDAAFRELFAAPR